MDDFRTYLERQIISMAFFHPSAAFEMCSILTEENFKNKSARFLYSVIRACFDRGEVEAIFYHREISLRGKDITPDSVLYYTYPTYCANSPNVRHKCLILIEFDMRDKFGEQLKINEKAAVTANDFEMASMWKQCFDFITNPQNDIFDAIPAVKKYLSEYAKDELDKFNRLEEAIPKMIDRVKGKEKARKLLDTLTTMEESFDIEPERKSCIHILKDLMTICIARLPMPENLYHTLSALERNKWQIPTEKSSPFPNF